MNGAKRLNLFTEHCCSLLKVNAGRAFSERPLTFTVCSEGVQMVQTVRMAQALRMVQAVQMVQAVRMVQSEWFKQFKRFEDARSGETILGGLLHFFFSCDFLGHFESCEAVKRCCI